MIKSLISHISNKIHIPGQGCSSQFSVIIADPSHSFPPFNAIWETVLLADFTPSPQEEEQSVQLPYADHSQSTVIFAINRNMIKMKFVIVDTDSEAHNQYSLSIL